MVRELSKAEKVTAMIRSPEYREAMRLFCQAPMPDAEDLEYLDFVFRALKKHRPPEKGDEEPDG